MNAFAGEKLNKWIFLLLPASFMVMGFVYIHHNGLFFPVGVDPEYAYLFNGITLAHFHPYLNCVGHPGTPIQCLIATVSWIVHIFRPGLSLWDDVIQHPEIYIRAALYTANIINTVFLYLLGRFSYRYSKNLIVAIVLQVTPFAFLMTMEVSCRLMPELIMTSIISCWLIVLVKILYEAPLARNYTKYCVIFAILFGFSLADKLTFLPFFILPFIILPTWRLRLGYSVLSVVTFLLFAFPVMFNMPKFIGWVTLIFTHTGKYGGGEKAIIDWDYFLSNLKFMVQNTLQLLIPLGILMILTTVYVIRKKRWDMASAISSGLILLFILLYAITAKHFEFYYMTPGLLMAVFTGFMVMFLLGQMYPDLERMKITDMFFAIFGIVLILNLAPRSKRQLDGLLERNRIRTEGLKNLEPYLKKTPKIIVPYYFGCSSVEYGLLFGLLESGRYGKDLSSKVAIHFPSTLFYLHWGDVFYEGVYAIEPVTYIKLDTEYTLFIADFSKEKLNEVLSALQPDSADYTFDLKPLYHSDATEESVFLLKTLRKH
jgi:hypothetical protein